MYTWENIISIDVKGIVQEDVDWNNLAQDTKHLAGSCEHGNERVRFEFITTVNIKAAVLCDVT
jgi:hypothetical protein